MNRRLAKVFFVQVVFWNFSQVARSALPVNVKTKAFHDITDSKQYFTTSDRSINPKHYGYFGFVPFDQTPIAKPNYFGRKENDVLTSMEPIREEEQHQHQQQLPVIGRTYYDPLCDVFGVCPTYGTPPVYYPEDDFYRRPITSYDDAPSLSSVFYEGPPVVETSNYEKNSYADASPSSPIIESFQTAGPTKMSFKGIDNCQRLAETERNVVSNRSTIVKNGLDTNRSTEDVHSKRNQSSTDHDAGRRRHHHHYHREDRHEKLVANKKKAIEDAQKMIDYLMDLGTKRRKIPFRNQIMKIPIDRNSSACNASDNDNNNDNDNDIMCKLRSTTAPSIICNEVVPS